MHPEGTKLQHNINDNVKFKFEAQYATLRLQEETKFMPQHLSFILMSC